MLLYSQCPQAEVHRCFKVLFVPARVERSVPEHLVFLDRSTNVEAKIICVLAMQLRDWLRSAEYVDLVVRRLSPKRAGVTIHTTVDLICPTLGHNVDDAAEGLPVLRFKAAGLYLDFLNEVKVHARAL